MSQHAHNRASIRTVRPLGIRPQELFALTTDERRWTQIYRGVAELYPSWQGGDHLARHFVGGSQCFIICVYLRQSVVEKNSFCTPLENPAISFSKICENPNKTPHRKPSSTVKFFLRGPRAGERQDSHDSAPPRTIPAMGERTNLLQTFDRRVTTVLRGGARMTA